MKGTPTKSNSRKGGILPEKISMAHFSWKRWWLPVEFEIQTGWGPVTFFPNPEGQYEKYYNRQAATLSDLSNRRLLILCGEPAAGKTTVIEDSFKDGDPNTLLVRFREVIGDANFNERCFASAKWKALAEGKLTLRLIVESLDEGRTQFSNLFDHIVSQIRLLSGAAKSNLSLIFTCRTYDWEALKGREDELKRLLGLIDEVSNPKAVVGTTTPANQASASNAYFVWKLCPLRRVDAVEAGTQVLDVSGEQFLEAVIRRGMEGFAAWPHTLKMLLREYSAGTLKKKTRRELYESYSLELCRYRRDSDQGFEDWDSTAEERFETTRQLAALLICSGKKYICLNSTAFLGESDVGIDQITDHSLRRRGKHMLSVGDVRRALKTAIFSEYGPSRFGFNQAAHQECLAAGFLAALPLIQLRSLFFRADFQGKHIIPSLAHTASWIAEYHEGFRADLIDCNPMTLLRCDITDLPYECKPSVIEKMLELAASPDFVNSNKLYFEGLSYPGISDQFRSFLHNSDLTDEARELLFDMLKQVAPLDMKDELLAMCRGGSFVGRFYMIASRAVIAMAEREGTEALVALLNDKRFLAHDGQLNVRGILLQKLIPARLPAREAFKWIGPNEPSERSPTYHIFLDSYLPEAMTVADLPTGLAFFKNWQSWPTGSSTKASLALKIVIMALENLHDPAVSELITREWLKKHKRREVYPFGAEKRVKERFELNASLRYEFSDRLLDSIEDVGTKGW